VLEALEEEGIRPDLIVGCSAGAIVGSLYALRPEAKWLKEVLLRQSANDFMALHVNDFPWALLSNSGLEKFLNIYLANKRFQDLKIPFVSVATNLQTGSLIPFFTGPLVKPILASAAIPGAFSPVELYGTYFVDGGVADPVPVETARLLNADVVVAVEVGQQLGDEAPTNMLDIMWRSSVINYSALSKLSVRKADVAIEVPLPEAGMFSDQQNEEFYASGRASAKLAMPVIKKLLAHVK
jgi:NTE family protein